MSGRLDRFLRAQDARVNGYASALAEITAGAKRSHWIWYIFPQLDGLGTSASARTYAIAGAAEAKAYLEHPVLRGRLLDMIDAVLQHLRGGMALARLMGSHVDAMKLVSSLTLFEAIADDIGDRALASAAREALQLASAQGYAACEFTRATLGRSG